MSFLLKTACFCLSLCIYYSQPGQGRESGMMYMWGKDLLWAIVVRKSVVTLRLQNDKKQRAKFDANASNGLILMNVV